jgi:hypothetical protein
MKSAYDWEKDYRKKLIISNYINDLDISQENYQILRNHVLQVFNNLAGLKISEYGKSLMEFQCLISIFLVWFYKNEGDGSSYWDMLYEKTNKQVSRQRFVEALQTLFNLTVNELNLLDFSTEDTKNIYLLPIQAHAFFPNYKKEEIDRILHDLNKVYLDSNRDYYTVINRVRQLISVIRERRSPESDKIAEKKIFSKLKLIRDLKKDIENLDIKEGFSELIAFSIDSPKKVNSDINKLHGLIKEIEKLENTSVYNYSNINSIPSTIDSNKTLFEFHTQLKKINNSILGLRSTFLEKRESLLSHLPELKEKLERLKSKEKNFLTKFIEYYRCKDQRAVEEDYEIFLVVKDKFFTAVEKLSSEKIIAARMFDVNQLLKQINQQEKRLEEEIFNLKMLSSPEGTSFINRIPKATLSVFNLYPQLAEKQLLKIFNEQVAEKNNKREVIKVEQEHKAVKRKTRKTRNNLRPSVYYCEESENLVFSTNSYYFSEKKEDSHLLSVVILSGDVLLKKVMCEIYEEGSDLYIDGFQLNLDHIPNSLICEIFDEVLDYQYTAFIWKPQRKGCFLFDEKTGEELHSITTLDRVNVIVDKKTATNGNTFFSSGLRSSENLEYRIVNLEDEIQLKLEKDTGVLWTEDLSLKKFWCELDQKERISVLSYSESLVTEGFSKTIPVYHTLPSLKLFNNSGRQIQLLCFKRGDNQNPVDAILKDPVIVEAKEYDLYQLSYNKEKIHPGVYEYSVSDHMNEQKLFSFVFVYLPALLCFWDKTLLPKDANNVFFITNTYSYSIFINSTNYLSKYSSIEINSSIAESHMVVVQHQLLSTSVLLQLHMPYIEWQLSKNNYSSEFWVEDVHIAGNELIIAKQAVLFQETEIYLAVNKQEVLKLSFSDGFAEIDFYSLLNDIVEEFDSPELSFSLNTVEEELHLFTVITKWIVDGVSFYEEQQESKAVLHITWCDRVIPKNKVVRIWKERKEHKYDFIEERIIDNKESEAFLSIDYPKHGLGVYLFEFTHKKQNIWGTKPKEPKHSLFRYSPRAKSNYLSIFKKNGIEIREVVSGNNSYYLKTKLIIDDIKPAPEEEKFFSHDDLLTGNVYYKNNNQKIPIQQSSPVYFYFNYLRNYIAFILDCDRDTAQYDKQLGEVYWESRSYDNDAERVIAPLERFIIKKAKE